MVGVLILCGGLTSLLVEPRSLSRSDSQLGFGMLQSFEPLGVHGLEFSQFRFNSDGPLALARVLCERGRQLSLNVLQSSNVIAASMGTKLALVLFQHALSLPLEISFLQTHFGGPVRQLRLKMSGSSIPLALLCCPQCSIALCTASHFS